MRPRLRHAALGLLTLGALAGSVPAAATTTAEAETAALAEARRWQGRWCPPTGCAPPAPASAASVGGFAAAALGAVLLARRRRR
ncbi:hypothetical protein KJ059_05470 [Myxococcota bacterium]|nr:hypothetical protein [Myxococcota bacterium]